MAPKAALLPAPAGGPGPIALQPDGPPAEVARALLMPGPPQHETTDRMRAAGVFDAGGRAVPGAEIANFFWRGYPDEALAARLRPEAVRLPGRWFFGGLCRPHFGHQITNSLGRLPALAQAGALDGIVFIGDKAEAETDATLAGLMAALGITLPHRICLGPTEVESLVIAPDLFSEARDCEVDPGFAAWVRSALPPAPPPRERRPLYVTRSQLPLKRGRLLCEDAIERNLAAAGFEIMVPESLSIAEQIAHYRRADVIVGPDSSALHLAAMAAPAGARLIVIRRRPELPAHFETHLRGFLGEDYASVDAIRAIWFRDNGRRKRSTMAMAELDFAALRTGLVAAGALPAEARWTAPDLETVRASRTLGCPADMTFVLGKDRRDSLLAETPTPPQEKPPVTHTEPDAPPDPEPARPAMEAPQEIPAIDGLRYLRMLNRLHKTLAPQWYLQIGTNTGKSLARAACNFVAVDPKFVLSAPPHKEAAREMHLIQKTSDDFFASGFCERNGLRFDLAFLDGLHHYEVLLRDFIATEKLMAPGGVILLHDCCPGNVEMTSREECKGFWTGDVWKVLMILLQHRPDLDIRVANVLPTGLAVIRNLDPGSRILEERHDAIRAEWDGKGFSDIPGGLAGYYGTFRLQSPEEVLAELAP